MTELKQTALHAEHEALGAHFTDFGGWEMPLRYGSELTEHRAVREAAGLFDLSHMGEVWVTGPEATKFLNTALVGNLAAVEVGRAKYSLLCDDAGGIIDDLIVYRIAESRFLVVPNAGNTPAVVSALSARVAGFDAEVIDASPETALIAVQGPAAAAIVVAMVDGEEDQRDSVRNLAYYAWTTVMVAGVDVLLARTGYTGEDGFELYLPTSDAVTVWQAALAAGEAHGLVPAGLAARDSLRLEAGMPLYGNELSLEANPFEAGLGAVVSFKKEESFIGRAALEMIREAGRSRVLVGLRGTGRRAGRAGYSIHASDSAEAEADSSDPIGVITSGQPSPTLGYPIALAYVDPAFAAVDTELEVDLRGKREPFVIVELPFYRRQSA